jgi:hypothetical protein
MTLGNLCAIGLTQEVVVHEGLEGVVVGVAGMPLPLAAILVGSKVSSTPVVRQTTEPKETSIHQENDEIKTIVLL